MGFFSETVTVVASSTVSIIEDTPDYVKQAVFNAIIKDRDIVPDILDAQNSCFAKHDVARMYKYGKDTYTNGLPEGTIPNQLEDAGLRI